MVKIGPQLGLKIMTPNFVALPDDRTDSYIRNIRASISGNIQIVVIIFPMARTDKYSAVKKLCCIVEPIPSQVYYFIFIYEFIKYIEWEINGYILGRGFNVK